MLRPETTLFGALSTIFAASPRCAASSLSLISSQASALPPYLLPRVLTSAQRPASFSPCRSNLR
jgi:hypothetical protein